ncbi:orotidine-5'-phosphate decarboxylase [Lachnotalea sp. AF33-28]|uniref:orotidine-5'-phosphate decarboxylase n=1 Tax=Lachnotalea sp. AF33-28 TaxID=2292046 RepID=UPI000E4B0E74|nr:orotidine-5'-phosphate decarboxylase [Lachnotalea sp. AF33-28]RHP35581.1 orotidine-5'-phosphate decarboxylase [Lachnotalea sp. AF33-28]
MSMDRLIKKIVEFQNPTVAGLDPKLDYVPEYIKEQAFAQYGNTLEGAAAALLAFNKGLIDALYDIVPAVKPQAAYYEMYGWQGMKTMAETVAYAKSKGMFVILDGKRNDIGSTMEAYAIAHLGMTDVNGQSCAAFGADCLTVNGYLGTDGIAPLLKCCSEYDKGIFVLAKTSNPSSGELQDRRIDGKAVYEIMAERCEEWGAQAMGEYGYGCVGAVVGATYPDQLKELRAKAPSVFFLVPGYGAQGGGAKDVSYAFDKNGLGAVINSSRGIMCAYKKEGCPETEYAMAARREALRMKEDIASVIPAIRLQQANCAGSVM